MPYSIYGWHSEYKAAILEVNDDELLRLVDQVHATLFQRLESLATLVSPLRDVQHEVLAIGDALSKLRILERERLGLKGSDGAVLPPA